MSEPAKDRVGRRRRGPRVPGAPPASGTTNGSSTTGPAVSSKFTNSHDQQQPLDGVAALKELFPDWSTEDLEVAYNDSLNDVAVAVLRITEGIAVKSVQVKSKKEIRERREQENKEAREASRKAKPARKPPFKGQSASAPALPEAHTSAPPVQQGKQASKQASKQAVQPLKQAPKEAPKQAPKEAPKEAGLPFANHVSVPAIPSQRPEVNGKMTWAQILSPQTVLPELAAEAQAEPAPKQKQKAKIPSNKETHKQTPKQVSNLPMEAAREAAIDSASQTTNAPTSAASQKSQAPAALAAAGRPARPDGSMSWAAALASKPAHEVETSASAIVSKKSEKKNEKKSSTDREASSEKKEKRPRSARKKKSPMVDCVTSQVEKLDLPKGPAAERKTPPSEQQDSAEYTEQNDVRIAGSKQRAPEVYGAHSQAQAKGQDPRQASFPPQSSSQPQAPAQMQPPPALAQSQGQSSHITGQPQPSVGPSCPSSGVPTQSYSAFQPPAQPLQGQPLGQGIAQGTIPNSQEMPMMFNPYMTQYGMHGMPPMAANMPPYAMQMSQAPQAPQGQGQQMPGMSLPSMMTTVPMAPSPSMHPQVPQSGAPGIHGQQTPQSHPSQGHGQHPNQHSSQNQHQQNPQVQGQNVQDYGAYLTQYNYGFPARGYEYGYDQNAYVYPPYSYSGYAPQMNQPMVPQPDSPASQQKPMYWQGNAQYGQYYDPNGRHWGEYNQ